MIIGRNFLVKINANIATAPWRRALRRSGKDALGHQVGRRHGDGSFDGQNIHATRRMDFAQFTVQIGTGADLPALEEGRGKAEELTWEIFRDTLLEQAEQGVDYFTIHAGVLLRYVR